MKRTRINEQIRIPKVRLIDAEGNQVGVVDTSDALTRAVQAELDLVEISPNVEPPVCRIMDYGKYLFEQNKRKAAQKKKQKVIHIKEVKFRPSMEMGDFNIKIKKIRDFLERGDKVKVTLSFRGREMQHRELGMDLLRRICATLGELAIVDQQPRLEGRQLGMAFSPNKIKN